MSNHLHLASGDSTPAALDSAAHATRVGSKTGK